MKNHQPIGIFDSGIGGLTVMRQIMQKLPHERLIYFGDTARLPYGEKSPQTIESYAIQNAQFLMQHTIKLLVIACNTASAYSLDKLKQLLDIPIIDVIKPGADHVVAATRNHKIGVLATRATIRSGIYQREIQQRLPTAEVYSIACPLLVPLIEEHFFDHVATQLILKDYLAPLKQTHIDTLLLGCTHYPLLHHLIQIEMGSQVTIVDSATTCAEQISTTLQALELNNTLKEHPKHHFYASDDPEKFRLHGIQFLGHVIDQVNTPKLF